MQDPRSSNVSRSVPSMSNITAPYFLMLTPKLLSYATFGGKVALQREILFEPRPSIKPNGKIRGSAFLRLKNRSCLCFNSR